MDKDNDGCLTRLEIKYILMMENCPNISTDDSRKISFFNKDMIKNSSKYNSQEEMEDILDDLLEELDPDGEGKVDIVDFVTHLIRSELKLNG